MSTLPSRSCRYTYCIIYYRRPISPGTRSCTIERHETQKKVSLIPFFCFYDSNLGLGRWGVDVSSRLWSVFRFDGEFCLEAEQHARKRERQHQYFRHFSHNWYSIIDFLKIFVSAYSLKNSRVVVTLYNFLFYRNNIFMAFLAQFQR